MDALSNLLYGFSLALTPENLLACLIGVFVGTIVGVLPGIGPIGAMALLIPSTFALSLTTALIMLAGIYYGSMYGGSTTSILVNLPGEAASVVTSLEGYRMTQRGRAGAALTVAAVGSFVAGTIGVVGLMLFAPVLANAALEFGPPEYFALTVVGLAVLSRLGGGSLVKSFFMVGLGLALGTIGMEPVSGYRRFTFGFLELGQGIELVPVAMGLFGIAEVLNVAERTEGLPEVIKVKLRELLPNRTEWARSIPAMLRGTGLGFIIGLVPGPAAVLSSFASYALERRVSKHRDEFGHGAIEGVAGPESANNAATAGAMVPLLALGVPFAPATAMLLGALVIHNVQPGPLLMQKNPEVFWGVIASLYVGNVMLLILNLPMVGLFASLLRLPTHILMAFVVLLSLVGTYSINNSILDLVILIVAGGVGYILRKMQFDPAPLILALVLGPMMERTFRQTMFMSRGDPTIFLSRPLTAALFTIGLMAYVLPFLVRRLRSRETMREVLVSKP